MGSELALTVNGRAVAVEVATEDGRLRVRLGDRWHTAELERSNQSGLYSLLIDGRSYEIFARERPGGFELLLGNRVYTVEIGRRRTEEATPAITGIWTLTSPMSGIVAEVRVTTGASVQAGQTLVVVESMKMNNELAAARAGTVTDVEVRAGQRVDRGQPLLRIT